MRDVAISAENLLPGQDVTSKHSRDDSEAQPLHERLLKSWNGQVLALLQAALPLLKGR